MAAPSQVPRADDMVAPGWRRDELIRWGDRVEFDAPPFDPRNPTDIAAATQFGWDASALGAVPAPSGPDGMARMVLAVAHPTAEARMMFPGGRDRPMLAGLAQGASILTLERRSERWLVTDGGFQARRLTARTPCRLVGPLAPFGGDVVPGVLGIGGGCATPWGTVLLTEGDPAPWLDRLAPADALYAGPGARGHYGWMVELDPLDPQALPVKRTALGRLPRAGVAATLAGDGRAVVFMTDARPAGFLFRFVSAASAAPDPQGGNRVLLDEGTLSVACADGTRLRFVDLPPGPAAPLDAAILAGATAFDSPCGLAIGDDHTLHLACGGTPLRARPDAFNPRERNAAGHVLGFRPEGDDSTAATWSGEILLLGGDPAEGRGAYPEELAGLACRAACAGTGRDGASVDRYRSTRGAVDDGGRGVRGHAARLCADRRLCRAARRRYRRRGADRWHPDRRRAPPWRRARRQLRPPGHSLARAQAGSAAADHAGEPDLDRAVTAPPVHCLPMISFHTLPTRPAGPGRSGTAHGRPSQRLAGTPGAPASPHYRSDRIRCRHGHWSLRRDG